MENETTNETEAQANESNGGITPIELLLIAVLIALAAVTGYQVLFGKKNLDDPFLADAESVQVDNTVYAVDTPTEVSMTDGIITKDGVSVRISELTDAGMTDTVQVGSGETLESIGQQHGVSGYDLAELNEGYLTYSYEFGCRNVSAEERLDTGRKTAFCNETDGMFFPSWASTLHVGDFIKIPILDGVQSI